MRASIEEYKAVEEAAMKFVKSVAEGNSRYGTREPAFGTGTRKHGSRTIMRT